ncbi:MAG: RluA family pseudouridine synthase [Clostridia bacterium]|nr:RluA family pseudouridine synthase [Clostridia bacterium]
MTDGRPTTEAEPELFAEEDLPAEPEEPIALTADGACGRLDAFIAERTSFTRSAAQRLIETGAVLVNGEVKKPRYAVKPGDTVEITPPPPAPVELVAQDIPIDIVYQDEDIAVINKPVGMVVHPAAGNPDGTLVNALMYHLKDLSGIGGELRPGIVHRIDKDTSGLLVVAKNDAAHNFLSAELKTHSVQRTYFALCEGNFREDEGTVDAPIARHRTDRKKMAVVPGGREATTHWHVEERFGDMTLLRVELETGRTHQIRVHMAYINHPLVGDAVYGRGRNSLGFTGQALHAAKLRLTHPRTGERMEFTAPLPENFEKALEKLRGRQK